MAKLPIEDRILGSLRVGAINGDKFERSICEKQMREAASEIMTLRTSLAAERAKLDRVCDVIREELTNSSSNETSRAVWRIARELGVVLTEEGK